MERTEKKIQPSAEVEKERVTGCDSDDTEIPDEKRDEEYINVPNSQRFINNGKSFKSVSGNVIAHLKLGPRAIVGRMRSSNGPLFSVYH